MLLKESTQKLIGAALETPELCFYLRFKYELGWSAAFIFGASIHWCSSHDYCESPDDAVHIAYGRFIERYKTGEKA